MEDAKLKEELLNFVREKAILKGERILASGKKSSFYIDGKQVTLDPQGIFLMGKLVHNMAQVSKADAIGGPTLGADPIVAAVALLSSQSGHPIKALIVRKEAKDHGTQKMIEGPALKEGDRVVMVEDVITTGGSVLKAIEEIEKLKAKVVRVICLVDRDEGAEARLGPYHYTPLFTLTDLGVKKE
jgi:orotate phosphoribosyltransferase